MDDQLILSEILRYKSGEINYKTDVIIREISLTVRLNDINITTIACLDDKLKDLGIGFLSTEGILRNLD